jgi:hypothetical protein
MMLNWLGNTQEDLLRFNLGTCVRTPGDKRAAAAMIPAEMDRLGLIGAE